MGKQEKVLKEDKREIEYVKTGDLTPYARNSRTHSPAQIKQIAASIREFGFTNPVLIDNDNGIIAGHGRVMAAEHLQLAEVPCIRLGYLTETQKRAYVIADNKLALNAAWDDEMLKLELDDLQSDGFDLPLIGFTPEELAALAGPDESDGAYEINRGILAERFGATPFTVLNARDGWWGQRKRAWLGLGIESEKGRDESLTFAKRQGVLNVKQDPVTRKILEQSKGTSIFDPVLCELAYRWFTPAGGLVLDPFAGGSVRGIIASKLNRAYVGHELRQVQVEANRIQAAKICADDKTPPAWICGDSRNIDKTCADVNADFVFSCPPYADLEVYSDDSQDLSTLGYQEFITVYRDIVAKSCARLKNDRFACFVVGEVRDKKGNYYDFVGDTIQAFRDAGLEYYNEAILVTMIGSLVLRAGPQFSATRKLGKTHQNVLVFVKGDAKKAAIACGDCSDSYQIPNNEVEGVEE